MPRPSLTPSRFRRLLRLAPGAALVALLLAIGAEAGLWTWPGERARDSAASAGQTQRIAGPARVVDGDTLAVAGERIRLLGIDAPESAQACRDASGRAYACGEAATAHMRDLVGDAPVTCESHERDRYGRPVAVCRAGEVDLGEAMTRDGWALAYVAYSDRYVAPAAEAKAEGLGLWEGAFTPPWDWRRLKREGRLLEGEALDAALDQAKGAGASAAPDPKAPSPDCAIKGNVSSSGQIFHSPGQRDYARTVISPEKGERWFCSAEEARAAGWRPAPN